MTQQAPDTAEVATNAEETAYELISVLDSILPRGSMDGRVKTIRQEIQKRIERDLAMPLPLRANCPYCDSGLVWTDEESEAIADLSKRLELRPAQVIRQALRTYQLQVIGEPDLSKSKSEFANVGTPDADGPQDSGIATKRHS